MTSGGQWWVAVSSDKGNVVFSQKNPFLWARYNSTWEMGYFEGNVG